MQLKETNHEYYCSDSNYYKAGELCVYNGWKSFKEAWIFNDPDQNYCFRFDIEKTDDARFDLKLYFILQRKGIFRPVWIKDISKTDMSEIQTLLEGFWEYTKNQWKEVWQLEPK